MFSSKSIKLITGVGVGTSTLGAVITDVISPLGPYGFILMMLLLMLVVLSFIIHSIPVIDNYLSQKLEAYWYWPTAITILVAAVVMGVGYSLTKISNNNGSSGYLASVFHEITVIQEDLGIIKQDIADIKTNTAITAKNTEEIKKNTAGSKREVSADPRKELANMGMLYNIKNFEDACVLGDMKVVKLFLAAGMNPSTVNYDEFLSESNKKSIVIRLIDKKLEHIVKLLRLFLEYGTNVNETMLDYGKPTSMLIASAKNNQFDAIKFLLKNGAKDKILLYKYKGKLATIENMIKGNKMICNFRYYPYPFRNAPHSLIEDVTKLKIGQLGEGKSDPIYDIYNTICKDELEDFVASGQWTVSRQEALKQVQNNYRNIVKLLSSNDSDMN